MQSRLVPLAVYLAAFWCGWALMSLEILGGRMLAPDFGGGVYTWGSLISTFLISLSVGYVAGGLLSNRVAHLGVLALLVACSGALLLVLPAVTQPISDAVFEKDLGDRLGPLTAALALFTLPGILMGMVSPYCVRLSSTTIETVGATSGRLYAVSTIGSTLGTLATTFFLIPTMGVKSILLWTGGGLIALAGVVALVAVGTRVRVAAPALLLLLCLAPAHGAEKLVHSRESAYSRIMVWQEGNVRVMRFARKGINSEESRIDVKAPHRMLNEYTGTMFAGLLFVPQPRDVLVVGLGGGVVPGNLRRYYPEMRIDNVEIDPAVVDVAREWFLFRTDPLMQAITSDGRVYVKRCRKQYDIVFLDAFQGRDIPFHLKTKEFLDEVKRVLKPGGVVVSNLHRGPRLYDSERQTYNAAYPTHYAFGGTRSGNLILVSSMDAPIAKTEILQRAKTLQAQKRFTFDIMAEARKLLDKPDWDNAAKVLTDDFAPVETLSR